MAPTLYMAPTLFMAPTSPAVRSVQITVKALGIQLQEQPVNLAAGEQLRPEYLKINPQHTVPTLAEEDGFTFWDSHAINAYLVSKYGKDDSLYPRDLRKRAVVDQRLHFDTGVSSATNSRIIGQFLGQGKTRVDEEDVASVNQTYAFLEAFLEDGKPWIAGATKTIADYSLYTSVTTGNIFVPLDAQKYPKLTAWLAKVDALPEVEVSKQGLAMFEGFINSLRK